MQTFSMDKGLEAVYYWKDGGSVTVGSVKGESYLWVQECHFGAFNVFFRLLRMEICLLHLQFPDSMVC